MGPTGPTGLSGVSQAYVEFNNASVPNLPADASANTAIASLTVPAGAYIVIGAVRLTNLDTSAGYVSCFLNDSNVNTSFVHLAGAGAGGDSTTIHLLGYLTSTPWAPYTIETSCTSGIKVSVDNPLLTAIAVNQVTDLTPPHPPL